MQSTFKLPATKHAAMTQALNAVTGCQTTPSFAQHSGPLAGLRLSLNDWTLVEIEPEFINETLEFVGNCGLRDHSSADDLLSCRFDAVTANLAGHNQTTAYG
ncbi:MAG: hypothetical protein PVF93_06115 [Chromatiaceae bacterium]|jgi:hypothetical protein